MERSDRECGSYSVDNDNISVDPSASSVNNLILEYYKKFGRKRDLEQFFSLSTAQSEIRDPTGTFWRNMKSQDDSLESDEKKSESSTELCRISIQCSIPEPPNFQKRGFEGHQNFDSDSPPIVSEEVVPRTRRNSDEESIKSDDVQSQKSNDATLDTSMNKPPSPTSSITSQRKLEWDSLADVGYGNESDKRTSASSLSTLERLALNQCSQNDSMLNVKLGPPTSHSTPLEQVEIKSKGKKGPVTKPTKIHQKDVDLVELNFPHNSQMNLPQAISVNLSKHICFNVEKDGGVNIDNIKKDISISPEKNNNMSKESQEKQDKEIQTSVVLNKDKITTDQINPTGSSLNAQKYPVLISLNSLKKRNRKRKFRIAKKNFKNRNKLKIDNEDILKSKTTDQVSEAESFEYMPGHIYNQNHLKINQSKGSHVGNKSSLESSAGLTTDSSKRSKHFFSKDFEKSIDLLKTVLQQNTDDSTLKKKLIKEVVQRLIKSKYKDDESSTDFLSGLSFNSKIIGETNNTTTSTSDTNNTRDKSKSSRPKKSILHTAKFDSNAIASTSQSAPNLPTVSNSEKPVRSCLNKPVFLSNSDSEKSVKEKEITDLEMISSEEFYKKYLEALKREQAHRKHLQDKESFLKQKLVSSDTAISQLVQADLTAKNKLKSLIKDLTRNNYNDGSGDASKLEGYSDSNTFMDPRILLNNQRSHSVFTLSSGHTDSQSKNPRLKKIIKSAIQTKAGSSKNEHHYCCCPFHTDHAKVGFTDSSVQVDIERNKLAEKSETDHVLGKNMKCVKCKKESPKNIAKVVSDSETGDLKYVCVCTDEAKSREGGQNFLVYKCSRLMDKSVQLGDSLGRSSCSENEKTKERKATQKQDFSSINIPQHSKSSQTNVHLNLMAQRKLSVKSISSQCCNDENNAGFENECPKLCIQEAIRSIQTDISINPKLSDPCLSDINIIDGNECVKLIKKQYRERSKSNTENNTDQLSENMSQVLYSDSLSKVMSKSSAENMHDAKKSLDYTYIGQLDKEVQSDIGLVDQNENFSDRFTIPIQGTNMTLKVNLGTRKGGNNNVNNVAVTSQGVTTEKTHMTEQFTSLREDCTKGAQCCKENLFQQIQHGIDSTEQDCYGNNKATHKNEELPQGTITCAFNTSVVDTYKCNTYPKKDEGSTRKPFLRSNTDPCNFEKLSPKIDFKCEKPVNKQDLFDNCQTTDRTKKSNQKQFERCASPSNKKNLVINELTQPETTHQPPKCTSCSDQKGLTTPRNLTQPEKCTTCSNEKVLKEPTMSDCTNQQNKCISCQEAQPAQPIQNEPRKCISSLNKNESTDHSNKVDCQIQNKKPKDEKTLTAKPKTIVKNQIKKCMVCSNNIGTDYSSKSGDPIQTENSEDSTNKKASLGNPIVENQPEKCTACVNKKVIMESPRKPNHQNQISKSSCFSNQKASQNESVKPISANKTEKCTACSKQKDLSDQSKKCNNNQNQSELFLSCSSKCSKSDGEASKALSKGAKSKTQSKNSTSESDGHHVVDINTNPILDVIEGITKRYTKTDLEKGKRKRCFKEIMNILNYLLDTEEGTDDQNKCNRECSSDRKQDDKIPEKDAECCPSKTFVDKGVQLSAHTKWNKCCNSDSSEIPVTSELPTTSSDSATCKLLKKIKRECEKYHQRRCNIHSVLRPCETSSTTSVTCEQCRRVHHCYCLRHKCKTHRTKSCGEKPKKKCIAYNLILQTSDSVVSEEPMCAGMRPLKSVIIKVPSKRTQAENVPFKEMAAKFERNLPHCSPRSTCKGYRSRSLPNESEISSTEEFLKKPQTCTVREYLERNRPDFVEKCSKRQDCLKTINETRPDMCSSPIYKMVVLQAPNCATGLDPCNMCYGGVSMSCNPCIDPYTHIQNEVTRIANERHAKRKLLSLQLAKQQTLSALTDDELRHFARQLSEELRRKKVAPKFINEREMKRHSEKIYKTLPEVTRRKEELKKENIKKTNLLMANIFKKNLQKKTLRGSVNLSNYSTVIKI